MEMTPSPFKLCIKSFLNNVFFMLVMQNTETLTKNNKGFPQASALNRNREFCKFTIQNCCLRHKASFMAAAAEERPL